MLRELHELREGKKYLKSGVENLEAQENGLEICGPSLATT